VRTALCVEPRGGGLYVFLPPVKSAEDFLRMVAAWTARAPRWISRAARRVPSAAKPDLSGFSLAPDPGVLE